MRIQRGTRSTPKGGDGRPARQWTAQGGGPHTYWARQQAPPYNNSKRGKSSSRRIGADLSRRALVGNGPRGEGPACYARQQAPPCTTTATAAKAAESARAPTNKAWRRRNKRREDGSNYAKSARASTGNAARPAAARAHQSTARRRPGGSESGLATHLDTGL